MNQTRRAVSGFAWVSISNYATAAVSFTGSIYLARNIDPKFFGQTGLAVSTLALLWVPTMIGFGPAIVRQQENIKVYVATLLSLKIIIVLLLMASTVLLWQLSWLPGSAQVQSYLVILALSQIPVSILSLHAELLRKYLLFRSYALISALPKIGAVILACYLAFRGETILALLWLIMAENLFRAGLVVVVAARQRVLHLPGYRHELALDFFHYAKHVVVLPFLERGYSRIDDIAIGTFAGAASLGFYQRAYGLCGILRQFITGAVPTITGPFFSQIQNDPPKLGQSFEQVGRMILILSTGAYLWLALVIPDVTVLLYGENWLPMVPLLRLLLPYAMLQSFRAFVRNTHLTAGSPAGLSKGQFIETGSLLLLLFPLLYFFSTPGASVAVSLSAMIGILIFLRYFKPLAHFSIRRLFTSPIIAAVFATLLFMAIQPLWADYTRLPRLLVNSVIIGISYLGLISLLDFSLLRQLFRRIRLAYR